MDEVADLSDSILSLCLGQHPILSILLRCFRDQGGYLFQLSDVQALVIETNLHIVTEFVFVKTDQFASAIFRCIPMHLIHLIVWFLWQKM